MGVAFCGRVIPGVLLRVTMECTRGSVLMLAFVVGVDEVCTLCSCLVSNFSVAVSNIFVSCSKSCPCRPVLIFGSFNILCIALVRILKEPNISTGRHGQALEQLTKIFETATEKIGNKT